MATLQSILNEIQYGKSFCEFQTLKEEIEKNYDQDTDIFSASGRINKLVSGLVMEDDFSKIVEHISNKCSIVEEKLYRQDVMSPQYKKIQAVSITEDCNKIISKTLRRGDYEKIPSKEAFAKIISTAKFFVENYLDDKVVFKECENFEFRTLVNNDLDVIKQVL